MKIIKKHELVYVTFPAGSNLTQFNFPDQPNLRNAKIWGIQAYYSAIIPQNVITQNITVPKNVFQTGFLTLLDYKGNQFCQQIPLPTLQTIENGLSGYVTSTGETEIDNVPTIQEKDFKNFDGQIANWSKCFVQMPVAISTLGADTDFLFSVYYTDLDEIGKGKGSQTTFAKKS